MKLHDTKISTRLALAFGVLTLLIAIMGGVSLLKVQVRKVSNFPRLVATVRAGKRVITHGAIAPKVGLQTIRLANYVQYLPKGTRLSVSFGDSSGADIAYLGFGDSGSISLGPAFLSLQVLTKPVSG